MKSVHEELGNSIFLEIFGDSLINQVLDFLVVFDRFDYTMADIAVKSGVSYSTLKTLLKELIARGLIVQSRVSGKSKMYKLNKNNPLVQKFVKFYWQVTDASVEKDVKKKKLVVVH